MSRFTHLLLPAVSILLAAVLPAAAAAQQTCVAISDCDGGVPLNLCNEICGGSCLIQWYDVGGKIFECSGYDCQDAAEAAVAYCVSGVADDQEEPCEVECGGGCCDAGQACCADKCVPATAKCCADGTYCQDANAECCEGKCIPAGTVCCAGGSCPEGQQCVDSQCVPENGVKCEDGSYCPENTACASGKCCADGFASYDPVSGFCCGAGPEAGMCVCAVGCAGFCCPAGTNCCEGGYCSTGPCPSCSQGGQKVCPDHKGCAPVDATCCGEYSYCTNGLTCMDCPTGKCCGNQSSQANGTTPLNGTVGTVELFEATASNPAGDSTATTAPTASGIDAMQGEIPAGNGCQAGTAGGGMIPILMCIGACVTAISRRRRHD